MNDYRFGGDTARGDFQSRAETTAFQAVVVQKDAISLRISGAWHPARTMIVIADSGLPMARSHQLGEVFPSKQCWNCAGLPVRSESSRCSPWAGSARRNVDRIVADLRQAGHEVSIENVAYEFQRGGNQMMRIRPRRDKELRLKPTRRRFERTR